MRIIFKIFLKRKMKVGKKLIHVAMDMVDGWLYVNTEIRYRPWSVNFLISDRGVKNGSASRN
jgi:hypothetical protein